MSETILDHGYVPEEHAPDPVISHGDPTPPGKVGIWLFLASEIMFFIGVLGTYIVIRSGWPHLFETMGRTLSKPLAGVNTLVLIFSSLTMALSVDAAQKGDRGRLVKFLWITFACALTFMGIKAYEYNDKFHHYTMVVTQADGTWAYDGHLSKDGKEIHGVGVKLVDPPKDEPHAAPFNIYFAGAEWIEDEVRAQRRRELAEKQKKGLAGSADKIDNEVKEQSYRITGHVAQQVSYGPWKNLFFSSYFAATGIHGLHVLGGMIPLSILAIQAGRRKIFSEATEYVGLYWHFVDLVWIFLFPLLYLI